MSTYSYPTGQPTFGSRDELPATSADKIISGANFDVEFTAITTGKLDKSGTDFSGTISNASATVDGGTFA